MPGPFRAASCSFEKEGSCVRGRGRGRDREPVALSNPGELFPHCDARDVRAAASSRSALSLAMRLEDRAVRALMASMGETLPASALAWTV